MPRPDELAAHVERDDLARAEPRVHASSVCDGTGRGEVVLVVDFGKLSFRRQLVLPQLASIGAAQRRHQKRRLCRSRRRAAAERAFTGVCRVATLHERRMITRAPRAAADLRRHEHLIAPHDRRRYAEAADGRFPRDVLRVAPPLRQGGFPRHTSGRRPSPMGPVLGVELHQSDRQYHRNDAGFCHRDSLTEVRLTRFSIMMCRNGNQSDTTLQESLREGPFAAARPT